MGRQKVRLWYTMGMILVFTVSGLAAQGKNEKEKGIKLPEKVIRGQVAPQDIKQKKGLQKETPLFEEEKGLSPLPVFNKNEKTPGTRTDSGDTHSRVAFSGQESGAKKTSERYSLTNLTVYGGAYGEFFAGVLHGQQFKRFDILFDGYYHQENGWRKHMGYQETEGKLDAGLYLDGHRLEINAYAYNRLMELPGAVDFEKLDSSRYTDNGGAELVYTMRLTDLNSLKMKLFADKT